MTIAFESSSGDQIQRAGPHQGLSYGSSNPPEPAVFSGDRRFTTEAEETSSSSSIGRNSDSESDGGGRDSGDGDGEVQSECKGPLDCLDALEEVLPTKRGMSKFYNGKSKSFTSLADVVTCSSIKEIVKPENALTRKRKNLLAHATFWDKNRNFPPKNNSNNSISKKPTNSNSSNESDHNDNCNSSAMSRPPLHPKIRKLPNDESSSAPICRNFSPWRSFSLCDLQGVAVANPTFK